MKINKMHVLLLGLALGALATVVFTQGKRAARRYINLPNRNIQAPFSDAVMVNDTLYLSGKLGLTADGKPPADVAEEARLLLEGIKAVLQEANLTMDDLVFVQVFCSDVAHYDTFNRVYRGYFGKNLPARAFIGSGPLLRGARFEMQAIAAKPK